MPELLSVDLHRITWLLDRKAEVVLADRYGVSFSWFRMLSVLATTGPVTQHRLAAALSVSDAAVSRLLDKVTAAGLVDVTTDPTHQRKRIVSLTRSGRALVGRAGRELERLLERELRRAGVDVGAFAAMTRLLLDQLVDAS